MKTAPFGLACRPFIAEPMLEGYAPFGSMERARTQITRCIERQEGIGLVTGLSGTGKTLLCRRIREDFRTTMETILLNGSHLKSSKVLFQSILSCIAVPNPGNDASALRLAVLQNLQDPTYFHSGLLLLLDDAQNISLRTFEEIRQLLDIAQLPQNGFQLVLFGDMSLEEKLSLPQLNPFSQRIAVRFDLAAFTRDETVEFLRQELRRAGNDGTLFSRDVCREIYRFSDGIPRRTNQLADHVLLLAAENPDTEITPQLVQKAWRSLQQFPDDSDDNTSQIQDSFQEIGSPEEVSAMKINTDTDNSIEFGSLEDTESDLAPNSDFDLDFISESKPVSDLDLDPEHTIDFEHPANSKKVENSHDSGNLGNSGNSGGVENDAPTQIWPNGSFPGAAALTLPKEESELGSEGDLDSKNSQLTRSIIVLQNGEDGSPQATPKSVGVIPENDDFSVQDDILEETQKFEKKQENSPYSALEPEKTQTFNPKSGNFVPTAQRSNFGHYSTESSESQIPAQTEAPLVLSEVDRLIFQSYLEETTQSFGRLYRILDTMRAQFSTPQAEDFSPDFWYEMHDMSQQTIANLAKERMARWHTKRPATLPISEQVSDVTTAPAPTPIPAPTRYNAESILEAGSIPPTTQSHKSTSHETIIRQDFAHPTPTAKEISSELDSALNSESSEFSAGTLWPEPERQTMITLLRKKISNPDIGPEFKARMLEFIEILQACETPVEAHADAE